MAAEQTVLFTVIPRGLSIDAATLPVSIIVSPRLTGAKRLGAFSDWLKWTQHLKANGLELQLQCDAQTAAFEIDQSPLRPALWEELFNEETYVRSHETFDDYADRACISFPVRQTLTALKSLYQEASVEMALPDEPGEDRSSNRRKLAGLVSGLDLHWDGKHAKEWRAQVRRMYSQDYTRISHSSTGPLDGEGLVVGQAKGTDINKALAIPFAVFHHMPTPEYGEGIQQPDDKTILDFHQALTSLNSYPKLLRALGLVFDLELPRAFVHATAAGGFGTLAVRDIKPGWRSHLRPLTHPLKTAYVRLVAGEHEIFFTAPRSSDPKQPKDPVGAFGLLNLDPGHFGLAQVDVDGAMHKTMMLAETLNPSGEANRFSGAPEPAHHPEVFDPEATLPSLRSGGLSLYADFRAIRLLETLKQSQNFNTALTGNQAQPRPFFAEDLVRGYRLDVWDSRTNEWHSLHLRDGVYQIGELDFDPRQPENGNERGAPEEGWVQLAATQSAPGAANGTNDLYLHEAIARWAGWSLSVPRPGKHLSRFANAEDALPRDDEPEKFAEDEAVTPFKMKARYKIVPGTLPSLRFGVSYRFRARVVDLAGNSLELKSQVADALSAVFALPRDAEGFTYRRFEPVPAPLIVIRDTAALESRGSSVDRLVIRTFNDDISKDSDAADTTAADRHLIPPRASIEMGERLGSFDDDAGKLKGDAGTWSIIGERDRGELQTINMSVAGGEAKDYPLEPAESIDPLPFFPDPLSRGAAIRNLPGTPSGSIGRAVPDIGVDDFVAYNLLDDPNPRAGSATLISFGETGDWQETRGFRFILSEPNPAEDDARPRWDPIARTLTVFLPKGETKVVPLTSYLTPEDLKLMGVWSWLRDYIEDVTVSNPQPQYLRPGSSMDRIAHVLQRAVEGGHWMLTPPHLLTLVHAVQQPIGRPQFDSLGIAHLNYFSVASGDGLETAAGRGPQDPTELAPVTAWRRLNSTEAYLLGALKIHGASTARVDLRAEWDDPIDDPLQEVSKAKWTTVRQAAPVDELPLPKPVEGELYATQPVNPATGELRAVGYYDVEHDQIAFVRANDKPLTGKYGFSQAAPRHFLDDTKRHIVRYTAVATSRYREYFEPDLDFTRTSEPMTVDVPASGRPLAPDVLYVVPTFGWERQTETNLKRSVRFGGGLRVYLNRPWFSSGEGELLGVALWSGTNGALDEHSRDKFKPFITQWGMDPIWQTADLTYAPSVGNFTDADQSDLDVSLEESSARVGGGPGRVSVVGFKPQFDETRGLWFADLTVHLWSQTYMPFVRLALVRYQPHALTDAKISRVVLADFAQLTPDRSAMVTTDPHHPRTLRVAVSGVSPSGPKATVQAYPMPKNLAPKPTQIRVRVQEREEGSESDLAWSDVPATVAKIEQESKATDSALVLWHGKVTFAQKPAAGRFRLIIEEHEHISANYVTTEKGISQQPGRVVYAEIFQLDQALIGR